MAKSGSPMDPDRPKSPGAALCMEKTSGPGYPKSLFEPIMYPESDGLPIGIGLASTGVTEHNNNVTMDNKTRCIFITAHLFSKWRLRKKSHQAEIPVLQTAK